MVLVPAARRNRAPPRLRRGGLTETPRFADDHRADMNTHRFATRAAQTCSMSMVMCMCMCMR
jgi:hypothetical protein